MFRGRLFVYLLGPTNDIKQPGCLSWVSDQLIDPAVDWNSQAQVILTDKFSIYTSKKEEKLATCLQPPAKKKKKFCFSLPVQTDTLIYRLHCSEKDRSRRVAASARHSGITSCVISRSLRGSEAPRHLHGATNRRQRSHGHHCRMKMKEPART